MPLLIWHPTAWRTLGALSPALLPTPPGIPAAASSGLTLTLDEVTHASRLGQPTAWLFGNEAWGLPGALLALADEAVAVPIYGRAESLNLAAAAAVCLYASARALRAGSLTARAQISPPAG